MDAAALLKSQGWRGKGFSLHPTDNNIGLAKPLLISRNTDGRGVGQKKHYTSDQWWLNAFDEKLKGLDTSKKGAVVQSVAKGKLDLVANCGGNGKYAGLYSSFVRGETMHGTMTPDTVEESTDATPESDDREAPRRETKEEKRARRAARALRRAEKAAKKAAEAEARKKIVEKAAKKDAKKNAKRERRANETKEERRARKLERRARKEARRRMQADSKGS